MEPREPHPLIGREVLVLVDPCRNSSEAAAWARTWETQNTALLHLLAGMDRDGLEPAAALLEQVRECRRHLADPPSPELRGLWHRALDEIWEAAHANLYGDLAPARQHADRALRHLSEMRKVLESWAD